MSAGRHEDAQAVADAVRAFALGGAAGPGPLDAAARAVDVARRQQSDAIVLHTVELPDPPDLLNVFEHAEAQRARRFYASVAERGLELVGIGCVREVRADTPREVASLRDRCAAVLARVALVGDTPAAGEDGAPVAPILVGGMAFEPRERAARAAHWSPFGSASFALPELLIVRRAGRAWLTQAVDLTPPGTAPPRADAMGDALAEWEADVAAEAEVEDDAAHVAEVAARLGAARRWLAKPPGVPAVACAPALRADARVIARYRNDVARVVAAIRRGDAYKVVLAAEEMHAPLPSLRTADILRGLAREQPQSLVYAQGMEDRTFLGASFERLVTLRGAELRTAAIAGTMAKDDAPVDGSRHPLAHSSKALGEQAIVVEQIRRALAEVADELTMDGRPAILAAGAFHHLHTSIHARLARPAHVLDVAQRLHPTPALGGHPNGAALALIRRHERFDRGWYGGPLGWVDTRGDGELYVALRCALAEPKALRIFAGSGLMADSDPEREARETSQKLAATRRALEPRA